MRFAVTFGQRYYSEEHPISPEIKGNSYYVIEADDEMSARKEAHDIFDGRWAFIYELEEFQPQIVKWDLEEVQLNQGEQDGRTQTE